MRHVLFKWYAQRACFKVPDVPPASGGGGGGLPDPVPQDPPKAPDPKPIAETPIDSLSRDVARLKKHTRLDEPPGSPAAKKQEAEESLPVFSLFD